MSNAERSAYCTGIAHGLLWGAVIGAVLCLIAFAA